MGAFSRVLQRLYEGTAGKEQRGFTVLIVTVAADIRFPGRTFTADEKHLHMV